MSEPRDALGIVGFNHVSFTVTDMERSFRFWTETLCFEAAPPSDRSGGWQERMTGVAGARLRIAHLHGYGAHVELIQYLDGAAARASPAPPNAPAAAHICLQVRSVEQAAAALLAAGASKQGDIAEVTTGLVMGAKAVYLRDPNGILIELVELPAAR
jgi:catechol 2,3-dioxygenase-like lactoylglutathione lyase family enzyme